jgi:hypothetical protein
MTTKAAEQTPARWRPRPLVAGRGLKLAGLMAAAGLLDVAAGTGLSYVAGFGEVRSVLSRASWPWLAVMAGGLCVSFIGYHAACRGIYSAESGYQLPRRKLLAMVSRTNRELSAEDIGRHRRCLPRLAGRGRRLQAV